MDLETYQELTGITVEAEDIASVTAQIRRTRVNLETLLGYPLTKKKAGENQYEEKGKTTADCIFRGVIGDVNFNNLSAPDEVIGSYRLFSYNKADAFFEVDPFTTLHKVKLVFIKQGEEPNGITHKTFDEHRVRVQKKNGIAKYIEQCKDCICTCLCDNCVQLAVDADWLAEDCLPEELMYLWADMVEYYSDNDRFVTAETLGTHSYKQDVAPAPEEMDVNIAVLKKYAGPNGSVHSVVVV